MDVRDQAAEHHLGMSRSLTLISQMMQSSLQTLDLLLGVLEVLRSESHWDYGFPGSKLRSRLSMTSWMLLSCLYLFVVRMLRSRRDSLILAVIFMSPLAVRQRSIDIWFGPGKSWSHWIMGCGAAGTCAGGLKSKSSSLWCFQSCSMDVRLGL